MTDTDELRRVPSEDWFSAVQAARDEGYRHFDWLGCVDEIGRQEAFLIIVRLLRFDPTEAVRVSTSVPRDSPELASIGPLFAGAGWHERESTDLFGVRFGAHDHRPLLIEEPYAAPPLRKDQVLAARAAMSWPGSTEPGESGEPPESAGGPAPSRRRLTAPGVPAAEVWGDRTDPAAPSPSEVAASLTGGRARRRHEPRSTISTAPEPSDD